MKNLQPILLVAIALWTAFPSPAQDARDIRVSLSVNFNSEDTLYFDAPALVNISLSHASAFFAASWNEEAEAYLEELRTMLETDSLEEAAYEKEVERVRSSMYTVEDLTIGTDAQPWYEQVRWSLAGKGGGTEPPVPVMTPPALAAATSPVAELRLNAHYDMTYGLPSAAASGLPPGDYVLGASLEKSKTNLVRITVLPHNTPDSLLATDAVGTARGRYHLVMGEPETALEWAERILRANDSSIDGHSLRGDVLSALERYDAALEAYRRALELFYEQHPDSLEPPIYLMDRVDTLENR